VTPRPQKGGVFFFGANVSDMYYRPFERHPYEHWTCSLTPPEIVRHAQRRRGISLLPPLSMPTGATHGALYGIDTEAEAVAGKWVIEILHNGGVLSREEFTFVALREVSP
jgi:hypothetical protein